METSKVYFTNLRTSPTSNLLDKMERLIKRAGISNIDFKDQFVAIKIHFGEPGTRSIRDDAPMRSTTWKARWKTVSTRFRPNVTSSSPTD